MKNQKKTQKPIFSKKNMHACAYPFLYEDIMVVDHELITDEIATLIGLLASQVKDKKLHNDLIWLVRLAWDINGSVRGKNAVSSEVYEQLVKMYQSYQDKTKIDKKRFTLPIGSFAPCLAELVRNRCKQAVRTLYLVSKTTTVNQVLFDALNVMSNLFYLISLFIRIKNKEPIVTFASSSYKVIKK